GLPAAPAAVFPGTSVWTGKRLIVVGDRPFTKRNIAEAYSPETRTWRRLPLPSPRLQGLGYTSVWTGRGMLVWGAFHSAAFNPRTRRWRPPSGSVPAGVVVWTGPPGVRWGGGWCRGGRAGGAPRNPVAPGF